MQKHTRLLILLSLFSIMTACGGGSHTGNYPNDEPRYQLRPDHFYSSFYFQEYLLSGSDTNGYDYYGLFIEQTDPLDYFDHELSLPFTQTKELTKEQSSGFSLESQTSYYSTNVYERFLIGNENIINGEVSFASILTSLPDSAYIGESGHLGNYTTTAGNSMLVTWQLKSGSPNLARFILTTSRYDHNDQLKKLEELTYLIDEIGDIYSLTITSYDASSHTYLDLVGTPL